MDRMCSIEGVAGTNCQPPPGAGWLRNFELWQVAAAWRTSMATFWRRPVFNSWQRWIDSFTSGRFSFSQTSIPSSAFSKVHA